MYLWSLQNFQTVLREYFDQLSITALRSNKTIISCNTQMLRIIPVLWPIFFVCMFFSQGLFHRCVRPSITTSSDYRGDKEGPAWQQSDWWVKDSWNNFGCFYSFFLFLSPGFESRPRGPSPLPSPFYTIRCKIRATMATKSLKKCPLYSLITNLSVLL